jgi:hypothetical protein
MNRNATIELVQEIMLDSASLTGLTPGDAHSQYHLLMPSRFEETVEKVLVVSLGTLVSYQVKSRAKMTYRDGNLNR